MHVDFADDRMIASMARRVEAIPAEVQAPVFPKRRSVAAWILIQDRKHAAIDALIQRIHGLDIASGKSLYKNCVLGRIANAIEAGGIVTHRVLEDSLAQSVRRDRAYLGYATAILPLLIVKKVDRPVAHNFAARRSSELIAPERLSRYAGLIVEPGVRRSGGVTVVLIERAMELICSALSDQRNLPAGGPPLIGTFACYRDAELLHRVARNRQNGIKAGVDCGTVGVRSLVSAQACCCVLRHQARILVVVYVGPVEGQIVLIASRAKHFSVGGHSGLHAEQFHHVPRLQRDLPHLLLTERISHAGVGCVYL